MSDYPTPTAVSQTPQAPAPATSPAPQMSPYQTPQSPNSLAQTMTHGGDVSAIAISHLVRTRKWVRLCSVLGFIGSALMLLGSLGMMVTGGAVSSASRLQGSAFGAGFMIGMAVMYIVIAFLYIYPSLRLWQYASSITGLENGRTSFDLEAALDRQRSFWKYVGIMITVTLVVYAVVIVIVVIGAVASGMR